MTELDPQYVRTLRRRLLRWYAAAARDLPWRRTNDPYAIWVSEVMLQQTQVATVIPFFERWLARFPTVPALAAADEEEVLQVWAGLGYYSRARALLNGARAVVECHGGRVPDTVEELRRLPGVGPYTAAAIASIAYSRPAACVDGNVIRVLCRLFALRGDPGASPLRGRLWELAGALISPTRPGDWNSAMMELGATICRPVRPDCPRCPVAAQCAARAAGIQEELPEIPKAPPSEPLAMAAAIVEREGRYLIARRGSGGRWAGMWQFPALEVAPGEEPRAALREHLREALGVDVEPGRVLATVRHGVTRFRVTLTAYLCESGAGEPAPRGYVDARWADPGELGSVGLPRAHQRLAAILRGDAPNEAQLDLLLTD